MYLSIVIIYMITLPFFLDEKEEMEDGDEYIEGIMKTISLGFIPVLNVIVLIFMLYYLWQHKGNLERCLINKLIKKIGGTKMNGAVINLEKGKSAGVTINLSKQTGGSLRYVANLFWNAQPFGGSDTDLDIMAIVSGADGTILNNDAQNIVFYNNPTKMSADKAIQVSEDNLTGGAPGTVEPEEWCKLDFSRIDPNATKVDIIIDIHKAIERRQSFGLVSDGKCIIRDTENNVDVIKYWFDTKPQDTGLVLCEFTRRDGEWVFKAKEQGYQGGLPTVLKSYGISAQ